MINTDTSPSADVSADSAGTWQLGDRTVNRIGLGAMRLCGDLSGNQPSDRKDSIAVLRRAVELGVNHIDTAAFYFSPTRSANELIGAALQPYPDELVITTKVGPSRSRDGAFEPMARPDELRGQVEENIRQLGLEQLDVVNLRWGNGMDKETGPVAEHVGALDELRGAGLIRHLGISNISAEQLTEALSIAPIVCVQNRYGLTERGDDDVLELCRRHGIAFVPFFAVATSVPGALPTADAPDRTGEAQLAAIAESHRVAPAQLRLAWTLHRGPHVLAIPGTGNPAHVEENIAAGGIRLTDRELATLDQLGSSTDD